MSKFRTLASRITAFVFTALVGAVSVSARPAQDATQANDTVNRAIAAVMVQSINPVIDNLIRADLFVDKVAVGRYIAEALAGKDLGITAEEGTNYVDDLLHANSNLSEESQQAYLKEAASLPGAVVTANGVVFVVITEGEGVMPTVNDAVEVKYVARLSDGRVFDDTEGETVIFDLDNLIPGFTEGALMMKPGGTYQIVIPADQAYGKDGIPGIIPGNAVLDFTVTLEGIKPGNVTE